MRRARRAGRAQAELPLGHPVWPCRGGQAGGGSRAVSGQAVAGPWAPGQNGASFSKKSRHAACQRPFFVFFNLRIYLYEESHQGVNILGLCTCRGLSWNVPSPSPGCPPGEPWPPSRCPSSRTLSLNAVLPHPQVVTLSPGTCSPQLHVTAALPFRASLPPPPLEVEPPLPVLGAQVPSRCKGARDLQRSAPPRGLELGRAPSPQHLQVDPGGLQALCTSRDPPGRHPRDQGSGLQEGGLAPRAVGGQCGVIRPQAPEGGSHPGFPSALGGRGWGHPENLVGGWAQGPPRASLALSPSVALFPDKGPPVPAGEPGLGGPGLRPGLGTRGSGGWSVPGLWSSVHPAPPVPAALPPWQPCPPPAVDLGCGSAGAGALTP